MELSLYDIKVILDEIESQENKARKQREFKSFQIYDGNLKSYVKNRIREMYPKSWDMYTIADYSLLKKITDKRAKAYKENPIRRGANNDETTAYEDITREGCLNQAMARFDKYFNQHKYALMSSFMELNSEGKPEFRFMPLAPYEFDCVKNDKGEIKVVILSYPDSTMIVGSDSDGMDSIIAGAKADEGQQSKIYAFWTDTNHYLVKVMKSATSTGLPEFVPIQDNPMNVNPWGILPFAYLPESDTPNYPVASPLPDQTVELGSLLSVYLTSGNMQIGQLVLKYPQDQDIQMITHGLMAGIKLPQSTSPDAAETTADYISPSPQMDQHRTSIMTFMNLILDENGIRPASGSDISIEKFSSGLDRMISESDVQDIIESNQNMYADLEQDIYDIVRMQLESINIRTLSDVDLEIKYRKPKMMVTDTERLNNIEKMLQLGLIEEWEKFMIIDPNLTEDQAKEKLARINMESESKVRSLADAAGMSSSGSESLGGGLQDSNQAQS
jgi:hypothetical protein